MIGRLALGAQTPRIKISPFRSIRQSASIAADAPARRLAGRFGYGPQAAVALVQGFGSPGLTSLPVGEVRGTHPAGQDGPGAKQRVTMREFHSVDS